MISFNRFSKLIKPYESLVTEEMIEENYKELIPYVNKHDTLMRRYRKVLKDGGKTINYKELSRLQDLMDKNGIELRSHAKRLRDKEK